MAKLEEFSLLKAPLQGRDAHRFVSKRAFGIQRTSPATFERYRTYPRAIKNISRLAISSEIEAYIVREDGHNRMVGFATIIPDVTVITADGEEFTGSDLDYLLDDRVPEIMHKSVAKALIGQNTLRAQKEPGYDVMDTNHIIITNRYPSKEYYDIPNRGLLDIVPAVTGITRLLPSDERSITDEVTRSNEEVILHHW